MPQNKPIPKIKGEFLLGNLRQMKANPFQALCEWQHDYGDLASFRLATRHFYLISHPKLVEQALIKQSDIFVKMYDPKNRGVAIFAKAFMGIPAQQAAKTTRPLMPAAAPAVLLHSLDTQQGASNIFLAMTRRDVGKPAFSLRKKRFVKTHALSLLGTTRLLSRSGRPAWDWC